MVNKSNNIIRIGTRGSPLALWQAKQVNNKLLMKSSFYQSELNKGCVIHYKSSSLIDDKRYSFFSKQLKVKYLGKNINTLIEMLYALLYVRLRRKHQLLKLICYYFHTFH